MRSRSGKKKWKKRAGAGERRGRRHRPLSQVARVSFSFCSWRHGGHVGGQEQKHFYFHVNSSRKYSFVLTPNMAALSRGCKPRILSESLAQAKVSPAIVRAIVRLRKYCTRWYRMTDKTCCNCTVIGLIIKSVVARGHWGYILTYKAVFNGPVSCESLYFVHYFCLRCLPILSGVVDTSTDPFVWLQADTAVSRRRTA